ncbi:MAG: T9SS type A sorting domain-containing protein [Bacteroidetes bacterium]|nr:T9SS type A sorting domain-containing protein [Bacteroidota bacterium]
MKRLIILNLLLFFCLNSFSNDNKKISCTFSKNNFSLEKSKHFFNNEKIYIIKSNEVDFISNAKIGEPDIPSKIIRVFVPLNAKFENINLSINNSYIFSDNVIIEPRQKEITTNQNPADINYIYPSDKYFSKKSFPDNTVKFLSEEIYRGYKMFVFSVCPFNYNTKNKNLTFFSNISFNIEYSFTKAKTNIVNNNNVYCNFVKSLCVNNKDINFHNAKNDDNIKYLLITNENMKEEFDKLVLWKNKCGVKAKLITVEEIKNQYTEATIQEKIKKCIYDYYTSDQIIYVALCGDDTVIPDQNVYGAVIDNSISEIDPSMPADYFYACFDNTFNWNKNNNETVGEIDDDVDLAPEVFLSRISVNTPEQANIYINKLIKYETNPRIDDFGEKFLMTGNPLADANIHDETTKSNFLEQKYILKNWNNDNKVIDWLTSGKSCFNNQTSTLEANCTNLINTLNKGYGMVHMATHGMQDFWAFEGAYFTADLAANLNNNAQGVIVTIACLSNAFDTDCQVTQGMDNETCLSEAFLRNPNGGSVAYLGCSREGWGISNSYNIGGSFKVDAEFYANLYNPEFAEGAYKFAVLAQISKAVLANANQDNNTDRWLTFGINPMGDPEMDIYTDKPHIFYPEIFTKNIELNNNSSFVISTGVENANVNIFKENDIFTTVLSDENGNAEINIEPSSVGTLFITIKKHNFATFQDSLKVINVENSPIANFESNIQEAGIMQKIYFENTSKNNATELFWHFEGGYPEYSSKEKPIIIYSKQGEYNVELTAKNSLGEDIKTAEKFIEIVSLKKPTADFIALNNNIYAGDSIAFADVSLNNPNQWIWTFEGASIETSNLQNPIVYFENNGEFKVSLKVINNSGEDIKTIESYIKVSKFNYCIPDNDFSTANALAINTVSFSNVLSISDLGENGYQSFTNFKAKVIPGNDYILKIKPQNKWPKNCISVWIDWNANGDFNDEGELVWLMDKKKEYSTTISIPEDVKTGLTGMRIRTSYDDAITDPCKPGSDHGEIEDYIVNILNNDVYINMDEIVLNENYVELSKDGILPLEAKILPENSNDKRIVWASSDNNIASVDNDGIVSAVNYGEAIISVKNLNNSLSAYCKINVRNTISIYNIKNDNICIYPNPFINDFTLDFGKSNIEKIYVYNIAGKICYSKAVNINNDKIKIDLSDNSRGVYFIKLQSGDNIIVKKIIKL